MGGLCEVRMALQPISWSFRTRKYCTASGRATPMSGMILVNHVPFTFVGLPFIRKPWSGSNFRSLESRNGFRIGRSRPPPDSTCVISR